MTVRGFARGRRSTCKEVVVGRVVREFKDLGSDRSLEKWSSLLPPTPTPTYNWSEGKGQPSAVQTLKPSTSWVLGLGCCALRPREELATFQSSILPPGGAVAVVLEGMSWFSLNVYKIQMV